MSQDRAVLHRTPPTYLANHQNVEPMYIPKMFACFRTSDDYRRFLMNIAASTRTLCLFFCYAIIVHKIPITSQGDSMVKPQEDIIEICKVYDAKKSR